MLRKAQDTATKYAGKAGIPMQAPQSKKEWQRQVSVGLDMHGTHIGMHGTHHKCCIYPMQDCSVVFLGSQHGNLTSLV